MHPIDRIRVRIVDAIASGIITLVIVAIVSTFTDSNTFSGNIFSSEAYLILVSLSAVPLLLTLGGLVVAVYRSGPFGFIGFLFELGGANMLFADPDGSGLSLIVFGAILVVFGAFIWSWTPVLRMVSRSRKRRRPPRRGF